MARLSTFDFRLSTLTQAPPVPSSQLPAPLKPKRHSKQQIGKQAFVQGFVSVSDARVHREGDVQEVHDGGEFKAVRVEVVGAECIFAVSGVKKHACVQSNWK